MAMLEQFWMVWDDGGRAPTFKHLSASAARAEAERLASINPGHTFFVLEAQRDFFRTCNGRTLDDLIAKVSNG